MSNYNGVTFIPIFELDREEERAIKKERERLNRAEAVLGYIGAILSLLAFLACFAVIVFCGLFIAWLIHQKVVILVLFGIGYIVGVLMPCVMIVSDVEEAVSLKFTCWWTNYVNRRIDDVKWEYKLKKAEAMNIEIDKAFN